MCPLQQAAVVYLLSCDRLFCNPADCSLPGSSAHGTSQARIQEWVAIPSPGDLPEPGIKSGSNAFSALQADSLPSEPLGKPQFPEQGSNLGLLHWKHGVLAIGPPGKSLFIYFLAFSEQISCVNNDNLTFFSPTSMFLRSKIHLFLDTLITHSICIHSLGLNVTKNHKSGDLKHLLSHRWGSSVSEPEVQTGSALSETSREGFFLPFPTLGGSLAILGSLQLQLQHFAHCLCISVSLLLTRTPVILDHSPP